MPDYIPIQDLTVSADLEDTDYVPVSDGSTTFAVQAVKFKNYSSTAAEEAAAAAQAAATAAQTAASSISVDASLTNYSKAASAGAVGSLIGASQPTYTENEGYVKVDGTVASNSNYRYTSPIAVSAGDVLRVVTDSGETVSIVCGCDSSGNNRSSLVPGGDASGEYVYIAAASGYVIVSYKVNTAHSFHQISGAANAVLEREIGGITNATMRQVVNGTVGYVNANSLQISENNHYLHSSAILFHAGETISAFMAGPTLCSLITSCNSTGQTLNKVLLAGNGTDEIKTYRFDEDTYVIFSWFVDTVGSTLLYFVRTADDVLSRAANDRAAIDALMLPATIGMYTSWAVIGDSYSVGAIHRSATAGDVVNDIDASWEKVLSRRCGNDVNYYATGGMTTQKWLGRGNASSTYTNAGINKFNADSAREFYVIKLGVNDSYDIKEGTYTLGSTSDINLGTPASCGDTFCGNLAYIMCLIRAKNPNARILVLGLADNVDYPDGGYQRKTLNQTMKTVVNYCASDATHPVNCAYIGEYQDEFFQSDYYKNGKTGSHPTAPVLSGMAGAIDRLYARAVVENYDLFKGYYGYIYALRDNPTYESLQDNGGWEFTANSAVKIVGVRGIVRSNQANKTIKFGTASGTVLKEVTVNLEANKWFYAYFDSPVTLESGTNYVIKLASAGLTYQANPPLTTNALTYVRGRFGSGFPGSQESGAAYSVDVLYEPVVSE